VVCSVDFQAMNPHPSTDSDLSSAFASAVKQYAIFDSQSVFLTLSK